ncbi:MAG: RuvX/YqgF family protein [Actinobacteria bacterium]|nr:RuvX/YqgF family protein [Actinomycetota bacterium]
MRIMALDVGEKNIGIAISDKLNILAIPHSIEKNDEDFSEKINRLVREKDIRKIIIGIPYKIKVEIDFFDERFSTKISKDNLLSSKKAAVAPVDKYAAAIILENYLNNEKYNIEKNENK